MLLLVHFRLRSYVAALFILSAAVRPVSAQDSAVVDALIVYTSAALEEVGSGSEDAVFAEIDRLQALTNRYLALSDVPHRVEMVGRLFVDYPPSGLDDLLWDLSRGERGFGPALEAMSTLGADVVHVFHVPNRSECGRAYVGEHHLPYAVTGIGPGCADFVFAHEYGHVFEIKHDRPTERTTGKALSALGNYGFFDCVPGYGRHTIMAYPSACIRNGQPFSLVNFPRFSTPLQFFPSGNPAGVAYPAPADIRHTIHGPADAVQHLLFSMPRVARYRGRSANLRPLVLDPLPDVKLVPGASTHRIDLFRHFVDPDGDDLVYRVRVDDADVARVSPSPRPFPGTVPLSVDALAVGYTDVTVTASDPAGLEAEDIFRVFVTSGGNRPPVVNYPLPTLTLPVGGTTSVALGPHFTDPDGDELRYEASSSDESIFLAEPAAPASLPGGLLTVRGVSAGSGLAVLDVADTAGASVAASIDVRVGAAGRPPEVVSPLAAVTVPVGGTAEVVLGSHFSDPAGGDLEFSAVSAAPAVAAVRPSASAPLPGGRLVVAGVAVGSTVVTVTAANADGLSVTSDLAVTVVEPNDPPELVTPFPDLTLLVGTPHAVRLSPHFRDPEADVLAYTAVSSDSAVARVSVSSDPPTLSVSPFAPGNARVSVTARDPSGGDVSGSFDVAVRAPTVFTDDPVVAGTTRIRAIHLTELRVAASALRTAAELPPFSWTDPGIAALRTPVRLVHFQDLRTALAGVYRVFGVSAPSWVSLEPPAGGAGPVPIRAPHIAQIRAEVRRLESAAGTPVR